MFCWATSKQEASERSPSRALKGENHFGDLCSASVQISIKHPGWLSEIISHKIKTRKSYSAYSRTKVWHIKSSCFWFSRCNKVFKMQLKLHLGPPASSLCSRTIVQREEECESEPSWQSELTKANSLGIHSDGLLGWFANIYCWHLFQFLNLIIFAFPFRWFFL